MKNYIHPILGYQQQIKAPIKVVFIFIVCLPSTPGKISVEYVKMTPRWEAKQVTSPEFIQYSGRAGGGKTILGKEYIVSCDGGCEVKRGTSKLVPIKQRKRNSSYTFVREDSEKVVYSVTTVHVNQPGESGKIRFRIMFDEQRNTPIEEKIEEPLSLKWKETKILDEIDRKLRRVVFTAFDGTKYELAGPSSDNPYIKISKEGGQLVLEVAAPEALSFFHSISGTKH